MSIEYPCVHFEKGLCKLFTDDKTISYCLRGHCKQQQLSNADRIRAMSDEELSRHLHCIGWDCNLCAEHERLDNEPLLRGEKCDENCFEHCLEWLKQPAEV